jgi:hypothetical protein
VFWSWQSAFFNRLGRVWVSRRRGSGDCPRARLALPVKSISKANDQIRPQTRVAANVKMATAHWVIYVSLPRANHSACYAPAATGQSPIPFFCRRCGAPCSRLGRDRSSPRPPSPELSASCHLLFGSLSCGELRSVDRFPDGSDFLLCQLDAAGFRVCHRLLRIASAN